VNVARRFWLAYLALAALLGMGLGLFILGVEKPGPKPPPPWSAWQPSGSTSGAQQAEIARYVQARYHLPSGHRLVHILVGGPGGGTSDPIRAVALARTLTPTQQSDIISIDDASSTAMYILCGDEKVKCAIKEGKASVARGELLRREALELALYTLRYVDGVKTVVTFFPPQVGKAPTYALFFAKSQLETQLHNPLRVTLPAKKPPVPGKLSPGEQRTIESLTGSRIFRFALQREQNGARVLVLAPPTA
jgi:hypothetical protein